MKGETRRTVSVLLCLCAVALLMSSGGAVTYAYLFDAESSAASISVAEDFGYRGQGACIDTNDNWKCDRPDIPVPRDEINTFSNSSADLVIPKHVGPVVNDSIDISAKGFKTYVDLDTRNGNSGTITTDDGRIQVVDSTVRADGSTLTLSATGGNILVNGSSVTSGSSLVLTTDRDVNARATTFDAPSSMTVEGTDIDASDSAVTGDYGSVSFTAGEKLTLDGSETTTTSGTATFKAASISADGLASSTTITADSGSVSLLATNGPGSLTAPGVQVESEGSLTAKSSGGLDVGGASMTASGGGSSVSVEGASVSAGGATLTAGSSMSVLATNGPGSLTAPDAVLDSGSSLTLRSGSGVTIDGAEATASGSALTVDGESISAGGATLDNSGDVKLLATNGNGGAVSASGVSVTGDYGSIEFKGTEIGVDSATLSTDASLKLLATAGNGGPISATGADISTSYGSITLESIGDIDIANAEIRSDSSAEATLNQETFTLSYDGVVVDDSDGRLIYSPKCVNLDGQEAQGTVTNGGNRGGCKSQGNGNNPGSGNNPGNGGGNNPGNGNNALVDPRIEVRQSGRVL